MRAWSSRKWSASGFEQSHSRTSREQLPLVAGNWQQRRCCSPSQSAATCGGVLDIARSSRETRSRRRSACTQLEPGHIQCWCADAGDLVTRREVARVRIDQGGTFDIWVQRLAGGDAIQLTRSPAADVEPAWSPDARNIVFRSDREGGGLFIVPAVGGPERQLTSFGVKPQWTPIEQRSSSATLASPRWPLLDSTTHPVSMRFPRLEEMYHVRYCRRF